MRRALLVATDRYVDRSFSALGAPQADAEALAAVLRDPERGAFDAVDLSVNEPASTVVERIEELFNGPAATPESTVLLYVTGHGFRDDEGNLSFAMANTTLDRRLSTAVSASFVHQAMARGPRQQVVILDCCFSGWFAKGLAAKAGQAGVEDALLRELPAGRGRAILTASNQLSFEAEDEGGPRSIYTSLLTEGLRSGQADLDGDGLVTPQELHDFVMARGGALPGQQRPQIWVLGGEGKLVVARTSGTEPLPERTVAPVRLARAKRPVGRIAAIAAVAVLVAAIVAGAAVALSGGGTTGPAVATGAYRVTIKGTVANGTDFEQQGDLRVGYPTGGSTPSICLAVGNPGAASGPGAIWFGSDARCLKGLAATMGTVTHRGDELVLRPLVPADPDRNLNNFISSGEASGCLYRITSGDLSINGSGADVSGGVNLTGVGVGDCGPADYTAAFSGRRVSTDPTAGVSGVSGGTRSTMPATTATGSGVPSTTGSVAAPAGQQYTVQAIDSYESLEAPPGAEGWEAAQRARFLQSVWTVGDDEVIYAPAEPSGELYPIRATAITTAGLTTFSGTSRSGTDTISTTVTMTGAVNGSGDPHIEVTFAVKALLDQKTTTTSYRIAATLAPLP